MVENWRDDPRVARMVQLKERALDLQARGHLDHALDGTQEGVSLGRELVQAYPEPVHLQELAAMLYGLAGILNRAGRSSEARAALEESRIAYEQLASAGLEGIAPLLADVRAREASSMAQLGWATSAVVGSDLAVTAYRDLVDGPGGAEHLADLVRVLGVNAQVLAHCGDPDLACASADEAIRTFLGNLAHFDQAPQGAAYLAMLSSSCGLASRIHAANGRLELALAADDIGVRLTQVLVEHGGAGNRGLHAAAIARQGAHLVAAGQPTTGTARLHQARATDAASANAELALVQDAQGEADRFCRTLGFALRRATELGVHGTGNVLDLVADRPGTGVVTPSLRCAPERAAQRAEALGRVGLATLRVAVAEGIRICFEAHVMMALVSERGDGAPPFWAELLDGMIAVSGVEALGGDIAAWQERGRPS